MQHEFRSHTRVQEKASNPCEFFFFTKKNLRSLYQIEKMHNNAAWTLMTILTIYVDFIFWIRANLIFYRVRLFNMKMPSYPSLVLHGSLNKNTTVGINENGVVPVKMWEYALETFTFLISLYKIKRICLTAWVI